MSIRFFNEEVSSPKISKRLTSGWIKQVVVKHQKKLGDISVIFCSDAYLLDINKQYLDHDYYTDIITFDYVSDAIISGDIFISLDRVKDNAQQFDTCFVDELYRVVIHGILHLLGFKDKTPEEKELMTRNENLCLELLRENLKE